MFERTPETIDSETIQTQVNALVEGFAKQPVSDTSLFKDELGMDERQIREICMTLQISYDGQLGTCLTDNLATMESPQSIAMRIMARLNSISSYRRNSHSCMDFARFNIVHHAA